MIKNWIREGNLEPFLRTLAFHAGYEFDAEDWSDIHRGLRDTDSEQELWYEYGFDGKHPLQMKLARDPGVAIVYVQVDADTEIEQATKIVFGIMQHYQLSE